MNAYYVSAYISCKKNKLSMCSNYLLHVLLHFCRENVPLPSPDTWCCKEGCQYCRYLCPCCMRLALKKVQISLQLKCCWHCHNALRDEVLPTANVDSDYKKIESLLAKCELPEPTTLSGWPKWAPSILMPPKYEHTLPTTVQYLTMLQVITFKRLAFIRDSIVSVEVYAKVSDDEMKAYMWCLIQFNDDQQYSTKCSFDKELQLIPSTDSSQSFPQCTDPWPSPQADKITNKVFKETVKPALMYTAMRRVFDSPIQDGPNCLLKSSLPDYFSFLPKEFVIGRSTELSEKFTLEKLQLPDDHYIVLHMTESSSNGDSQITYFLVMKITGIKKCNVSFFLIFDYREYKKLQLPQGQLNCSLQVVDGVEIRETKEGKPKVSNFMSDNSIRDDDHPYSLAKVQVMTEGMLSKVVKNVGYSSFYSLSKHVDVNR